LAKHETPNTVGSPARSAVGGERTPTPEPTTQRGRDTRAALLDAARSVFARDGFIGARLVDITAEAGKSVGVFYNYFDTKEALLEALASEFRTDTVNRALALDTANLTTYAAIEATVRVYWESFRDHAPVLAGVFQAATVEPHFAAFWRGVRGDARRHIAASVAALQGQGLAPGIDPAATASALGSMLDYFAYVWLVEGGEQGSATIDDDTAIQTLASIWFHAVGWTSAGEVST
jgi:AcrR family transcriptional regulator